MVNVGSLFVFLLSNINQNSQVLCHCGVCRKLSGGPYSTNTCIPEQEFKLEKGIPKEYQFTGGSGNAVTIYFCDICSTLMYSKCANVTNGGFIIVVKTGVLGDQNALEENQPVLEIFTRNRVSWVRPLARAAQAEGSGSSQYNESAGG